MILTSLFRFGLATPAEAVKQTQAAGGQGAQPAAGLPSRRHAARASSWDGQERRLGHDRRQLQRRREQADALLDTRAGLDRRQQGRRASDLPELSGFLLKA
ncbi:hypothetical protein [Chitinilyticum litopenaei]|uniref:hypothetical protein n=1 Tax=Chitinilyticum litopenaei TaxID=1121276 RepID=UPI00041FE115|nr:hypothetical protein [Chitinilyticum litopenaei]